MGGTVRVLSSLGEKILIVMVSGGGGGGGGGGLEVCPPPPRIFIEPSESGSEAF